MRPYEIFSLFFSYIPSPFINIFRKIFCETKWLHLYLQLISCLINFKKCVEIYFRLLRTPPGEQSLR